MAKRVLIFLSVCFLLMPPPAVYANSILRPSPVDLAVEATVLFLLIILVGALVASTVVLIRRLWKPDYRVKNEDD